MKHTFLFGMIGALVLAFTLSPAVTAEDNPDAGTVAVSDQETPPPPPPKGVSGATPDIKPPVSDRVCPKCGAELPRKYRRGYGGPQLGARDGRPGVRGERACGERFRGDRRCGPRHGRADRPGRGRPGGRGIGRGVAADRMLRHANELDLTDDQIGKLEMLSYEAKKKMIDLRADIEKEQLELQNRIKSNAEDMAQIKRHLSAIAKAKTGIQEVKIENLFSVRKVLTDEQKELIKKRHPRKGMILD
jgi:Spy/CpxP family protein refolding chaperone